MEYNSAKPWNVMKENDSMMKTQKKYIVLFWALMLSLAFCGCTSQKAEKEIETKVWSTYSTVKVMQNQKTDITYDVLDAECEIQMMRNETEGAQLVISAAKDISDYHLVLSELRDEKGNIIPTDDMVAYHQKYMTVNSKTDILNEEIVIGDHVPDMLLPMEKAIEFGENKIAAGDNQGITIEVSTTLETVPGIYTGNFKLVMDEESLDIPVTVEVWDIAWEGKREFQSSFLIYANALLAGEYEISEELVKNYQEFFLDYKMNTFVIRQNDTVETLAKEVTTFWENQNYSSICIPNTLAPNFTDDSPTADKIVEYIKEIVKLSSAEKPYFEDLYIYPAYFDEVDMYPEKQEDFVNVFKQGGEWEQTLQRAFREVKAMSEYVAFDEELKKRVEESILNIPAVIPCTTSNTEWIDELNLTFCPYLSLFDEQSMTQRYQRQAQNYTNGELWAYTCVGPTNPYPTFHIDDYNLGTRVTGWMLKKHQINGYLYWAVNLFEAVNEDAWRDVDPYKTAERATDCAGDGFLCYPGAYYGSQYPFPCIRLTAWRDTMDDYDMLSVYEKLLKEKAEIYGVPISFEDCVEDLYASLFSGTQYYNDDALVVTAREKLAQRIMALQSDLALVPMHGENSMKFYATVDTLNIDGADVKGSACQGGYEYAVVNEEAKGKTITVSTGDTTGTYYLKALKEVTIDGVFKNADSKAIVKENRIEAIICGEEKENEGAMARFRPYLQFETEGLKKTSGLSFTINLHNCDEVEGQVLLVMKDMTTRQVGSFLADGEMQKVKIVYHAEKITDEVLADAIGVRISFANTDADGKLLPNREISLENISVEMR